MTTDPVYAAFYDDDVTRGFLHSHSYTGNALACRAALATLELFERDDVISSNRAKAAAPVRCGTKHRHASTRQKFSHHRHDLGI